MKREAVQVEAVKVEVVEVDNTGVDLLIKIVCFVKNNKSVSV